MLKAGVISVMLAACLMSAGCGTERGPYSPIARADGIKPHQTNYGVTMMDIKVRNSFLLVNHSAKVAPAGQIQARILMQNIFKQDEVWADVRFAYYDADGMPVEYGEWRTYYFAPMDLVMIENNSIRGDVKSFNAQFRNIRTRDGRKLTYPGEIEEHGNWRDGVMPH